MALRYTIDTGSPADQLEVLISVALLLSMRGDPRAAPLVGGLEAEADAIVAALALLATPWDFHAGMASPVRMLKAMAPGLTVMINQLGELPIDVIQAMFASLTPYSTATKFNRFAILDPASDRAQNFVALEDWLNDGVPLTGPVARECLEGWYG